MTTRWKQKFCVTLAVVAVVSLLLMLILLWSAVSNGMLSTNSRSSINVGGETNLPTEGAEAPRRKSDWNDMSTTESSNNKKTEFDEYVYEEFVKPSKVHHLPLHTDDLLYESKRNNSITEDFIYSHRKTGNYKSKSSRIWDPHPEYTITAFGHHMHLMLYQDASFIPSTFKVTNDYGNHTEIHEDTDSPGCHYKGHVLDDEASIVAVSLCNGMTGLIKTSYGSFFIQPDKRTKSQGDADILHRIWREPKHQKHMDMERSTGRGCQLHDHTQDSNGIDFDPHSIQNVSRKRRKRDTYGAHGYTLEVLIAVDNKMLAFHKEDINSYVLTLMSIVSNIFSDASIGNSINVAVVDIWKIRQGLHLKYIDQGVYATDLLKEFCNYINDTSHHARYRFDTAILLTREQICRNATETRCDTLGLAELGTVCKGHSCSLVQDNGLSAAFTIAHELGHILNMPHDDDKKCYHFKKDGKPMLNIMSSTMGNEIHPWSWSDCSRHYVTEFLESENIYCMENTPDAPYSINATKLPGENYDLDQQCELIHGEDAKCCNQNVVNEEECGRLWCQVSGAGDCRSINLPWADGTPCKDSYHWCQKGECVHRDRRKLEPIHGGWGPWTSYTPCSRSCGSGVQESQRECNQPIPQNGGRYCRGDRKRYRSCNIHDCPDNELDFRELQCAAYNNQNLDIQGIEKSVKWIPKYGVSAKDECTLYCRIEDSSSYFKLADKVIDGTTCSFDSHNRCVNGVCRPSGCDNQLYSPAQLDRCGVCMGNNDTCTEIIGYVHKSDVLGKKATKANSYYDVIRIPKGASNIRITQPGYTETNYIVLLDDAGRYLLNGPFNGTALISSYKSTFAYAGVTFEYSGIHGPLEQVNTTYSRKIYRDLVVQILSLHQDNQTNHNEVLLTYSYTVSLDSRGYRRQLPPRKETFKWELDDWSPCDSICQGQRYRNAVCVNVETGQKVSSTHCDTNLKPNGQLYQACNLECDLVVNVVSTSECSETCGRLGRREKRYACIQKDLITNYSKYVELSHCLAKVGNMPQYEECKEPCWSYTEWSQCSRTCGTGDQKRSVVCKFEDKIVSESECIVSKKSNFREVIRPCNTDPCPDWAYGEETPCSVTCGVGQRTTAIYCMHNNEIVDKSLCDGNELHPIIIKCTMPPCPEKRIISLPSRTLRPDMNIAKHHRHFPAYDSKNRNSIYLSNHVELGGDAWVTEHWSECDDNCERTRHVYCKDSSHPANCPESAKPATTVKCCSIKYVQKWSQCSVPCGVGTKEKLFICARVFKPDKPGGKAIKTPVDMKKCQNLVKPRPKQLEKSCENACSWTIASSWTPCSSNRTIQFSTRSIKCSTKKNRIIPNKYCNQKEIPQAKRKCPSSRHYKEVLSNCLCDGYRKRRLVCYEGGKLCDRHKHKSKKEKCNPPPECARSSCNDVKNHLRTIQDGEYKINVKHRLVKIYCHNMTARPMEYISLNATENYSMYYAKSSKDPFACPRGLQRDEFQNEQVQAGYTRFKKIRLDVQRFQVIEDDYTFAETNGVPQKYGSGGDCYNRNQECPHGFFSVNLAGTGFRIARTTEWSTSGRYSSIKFLHELKHPYTRVQAFCGGYCGTCFISKSTNLVLDVI